MPRDDDARTEEEEAIEDAPTEMVDFNVVDIEALRKEYERTQAEEAAKAKPKKP